MPLKNTKERWSAISQLLHWVILALLVAIAYLGLTMVDLPNNPAKIGVYALHKSLGLTVLALVVIRLGWRWYAGAPGPVPGTPRWQERVASLTHIGLYVLMVVLPLSGWLFNSASGYPLPWFGLVNLPALAGRDEGLAELAEEVHEYGFWVLVALVAAHTGAALFHHFVQRDTTLVRMLPRVGRRS